MALCSERMQECAQKDLDSAGIVRAACSMRASPLGANFPRALQDRNVRSAPVGTNDPVLDTPLLQAGPKESFTAIPTVLPSLAVSKMFHSDPTVVVRQNVV
jgi:hypothetical protein